MSRRYQYLIQGNSGINSTFNNNTIGNIFTTGGSVGIGTSSPNYSFSVVGSINNNNLAYFKNTSSSGSTTFQLENGNGASAYMGISSSANTTALYRNRMFFQSPNDTVFTVNGGNSSPALFIQGTSGNVGINMSNPAYALDVNGTIDALVYSGGNMQLSGGITAGTIRANTGMTTGSLRVFGSGIEVDIHNTNYVIGATTGIRFSNIGTVGNNAYIRSFLPGENWSDLHFIGYNGTSNVLGMAIKGNGNVGINMTSPAYTLDVNGTIKGTDFTGGNVSLSGGLNAVGVNVTGGIAATGSLTNGGFDFILGNANQVDRGNSGSSRALVKQIGNKLVLNFAGDFTGGIDIGGSNVSFAGTMGCTMYTGGNMSLASAITASNIRLPNTGFSGIHWGSAPFSSIYEDGQLNFWTDDNIYFRVGGSATAGTTRMAINNSGNVCINTTRTTATLNVGGGIDLDGSSFIRGYGAGPLTIDPNFSSNNYIQMYDEVRIDSNIIMRGGVITTGALETTNTGTAIDMAAAGSVNINLQNTGSGASQTRIFSHSDTNTYIQSSGDIIFAGINQTTLRHLCLKSNGNIGINTTNPGFDVDIDGSLRIRNANCYISTGNLQFRNNGNGVEWMSGSTVVSEIYDNGQLYVNTDDNIYFQLAGTTYVHINGDGVACRGEVGTYDSSSFWSGFGGIHAGYASFNGDGTISSYNTNGYNSLTRDGLYIRSGRIGIGTASPSYPLHVSGSVNVTYDPNFFINGPGVIDPGNQNGNFSAYFSNAIRASEIWGNSDERIKTNIKDINDPDSLHIIRQLQPKTFSFIDDWKSNSELRVNYGFIAQEVENVLPDAVTYSKETIPTIMETCNVSIVKDENDVNLGSKIDIPNKIIPNTWKVGTKIEVIDKNGSRSLVTIKNIESPKVFIVEEILDDSNYFVYGEEVDDFRSVHRDVIYAITTAAVQELDKQLQESKDKLLQQQNKLDEQEKTINLQNDKIDNLQNKLSELENKLNQLLQK